MSCSDKTVLKIATLNVNGLKQSCQKVWDAKFDAANVLHLIEHLGCDIACFQEIKLSVADYAEFTRLVIAAGWDAYFSFTRTFQSYSGVATFCRTALRPRAAEEGLMRVATPQNAAAAAADAVATAAAAAAAGAADAAHCGGCGAKAGEAAAAAAAALSGIAAPWISDIPFPAADLATLVTAEEAAHLDGQGRCVITDHCLFVLVNAYLPACSNVIQQNRRAQFKMKCAMCKVLDARVRCLMAAGRHVLLAGDLNCLAWPQDCAAFAVAPHAKQVHFYDGSPCWAWLRSMLTTPTPAAAATATLPDATAAAAAAAEAAAATAALAESLAVPQQQQQQQHYYNKRMHSHKPDHRPDLQHQTNQQQQQQQSLALDAGALAEAAAAFSGCLIDTLRHFHPSGTALFADAKRPGQLKQRCLFTVWDPQYTRGNRVDKYGCRADFILLGDAAQYLKKQQQQQCHSNTSHCKGQQMQPRDIPDNSSTVPAAAAAAAAVDLCCILPFCSYMSAARVHRYSLLSDHAAVELQLSLPPEAAALLTAARRNAAAAPAASQPNSSSSSRRVCPPALSITYLLDQPAAAAAAESLIEQLASLAHKLDASLNSAAARDAAAQLGQPAAAMDLPPTAAAAAEEEGYTTATAAAAPVLAALQNCCSVDVLTRNIVNELQRRGAHCKRFSKKAAAAAAASTDQNGHLAGQNAAAFSQSQQLQQQQQQQSPHSRVEWGSAMQEVLARAAQLFPAQLPSRPSPRAQLEQALRQAVQQAVHYDQALKHAVHLAVHCDQASKQTVQLEQGSTHVVQQALAAARVSAAAGPVPNVAGQADSAAAAAAAAAAAHAGVGRLAAALISAWLDEASEPELVTAPAAMSKELLLADDGTGDAGEEDDPEVEEQQKADAAAAAAAAMKAAAVKAAAGAAAAAATVPAMSCELLLADDAGCSASVMKAEQTAAAAAAIPVAAIASGRKRPASEEPLVSPVQLSLLQPSRYAPSHAGLVDGSTRQLAFMISSAGAAAASMEGINHLAPGQQQ